MCLDNQAALEGYFWQKNILITLGKIILDWKQIRKTSSDLGNKESSIFY